MKSRCLVVICLFIPSLGLTAGGGWAQEAPARETSFRILSIPTNARSEALGTVGVGLIGSGWAMGYNPAGLAFLDGREAMHSYVDWFNTSYFLAGFAARVQKKGTLGLSVVNKDDYLDLIGLGLVEYAISAAYGFNATDRIALGAAVKLVHSEDLDFSQGPVEFVPFQPTYDELTHNVFALDLGACFVTGFRNTVLAMGVQHASTGALGEPEGSGLPRRFRAGLRLDAISMMNVTSRRHFLDLAAGLNKPMYSGGRTEFNVGAEYTHVHRTTSGSVGLSLRGGRRSVGPWNPMKPITVGAGVRWKADAGWALEIDYAHQSYFFESIFSEQPDRTGRVHVLSFAVDF